MFLFPIADAFLPDKSVKNEDSKDIIETVTETEEDNTKEVDPKMELNNSGDVDVVFCEFCKLKFTKQECNGRQKDKWRHHVYSKHLKSKIDEAVKDSSTHCPIENCDYKTKNPNRKLIIQHYIGYKSHGILEKLIAEELQLNKNVENEDSKVDFETVSEVEEDIIMDIDHDSKVELKKAGNNTIVCEFCQKEFSEEEFGGRRKDRWRQHIYGKHLKNTIDETIEDLLICPVENCTFEMEKYEKSRIVQHYISGKHGILETLIANQLQTDRIFEGKEEDATDDDLESTFIEKNLNQTEKKKKFSCDSCGKLFRNLSSLQQHFKKDHLAYSKIKDEKDTTNELLKILNEPDDDVMMDHDSKLELNNAGNNEIVCEFCGQNFSEIEFAGRRKEKWRKHVYSNHLKNTIDETIEGLTNCPVENCDFEIKKFDRFRIVQHYISGQHGILEKLIAKTLNEDAKNVEKDGTDDFETEDTIMENLDEDLISERDTVSQNL